MLSLDFFVQTLVYIYMPISKNNSSGVYHPKYKKKNALLARLVQRLSAFTSRCRMDNKAGRGALEPSPEDGARTERFDRENLVPSIPY